MKWNAARGYETADRYWHVPVDALHVGVAASLMTGQSGSPLHWTHTCGDVSVSWYRRKR